MAKKSETNKLTLVEKLFQTALPSYRMDAEGMSRLPSPVAGERFDEWASRASKELALSAAELRKEGAVWSIGFLGKSAKDSAVASFFGYALSAACLWRMFKNSPSNNSDNSSIVESVENMAFPIDMAKNAKEVSCLNKVTDLSILKKGPLPSLASIHKPQVREGALSKFTILAGSIILGTIAAPLGWGGFVAAQGALRAKAIRLAADAFDSASKLMSEESADGVEEFGRQEMAMAGWARACRAACTMGEDSGIAMMGALAFRARSSNGALLGAIPDTDAGWFVPGDEAATSSQNREILKSDLRSGGSESALAMFASTIHRNSADMEAASSNSRVFLESLATWWGGMGQSLASSAPTISAIIENAASGWIGKKDDLLINEEEASVVEQDEVPRDGKKLAGWLGELKKLNFQQEWPEEMCRQITLALIIKAVQIEAPLRFEAQANDDSDASENRCLETALAIIKLAGASLGEQAFGMGVDARGFAKALTRGVRVSRWRKVVEPWAIQGEWNGLADAAVGVAEGLLAAEERAALGEAASIRNGAHKVRQSL